MAEEISATAPAAANAIESELVPPTQLTPAPQQEQDPPVASVVEVAPKWRKGMCAKYRSRIGLLTNVWDRGDPPQRPDRCVTLEWLDDGRESGYIKWNLLTRLTAAETPNPAVTPVPSTMSLCCAELCAHECCFQQEGGWYTGLCCCFHSCDAHGCIESCCCVWAVSCSAWKHMGIREDNWEPYSSRADSLQGVWLRPKTVWQQLCCAISRSTGRVSLCERDPPSCTCFQCPHGERGFEWSSSPGGDTCCRVKGCRGDGICGHCPAICSFICCPCPCWMSMCASESFPIPCVAGLFISKARQILKYELKIHDAIPESMAVFCCSPWFNCLHVAQMERQLRIGGYLRHPTPIVKCAEIICCSSRMNFPEFEKAQLDHEKATERATPQLGGESITVTINGTAVVLMDSFYLSHVLQQLSPPPPPAAFVEEALPIHSVGSLTIGSVELARGAQSTCDETMKSLGVTNGSVMELHGSPLPATDTWTDGLTIEPPEQTAAPIADEYYTLPPGTGLCCSSICSTLGYSRDAADVMKMVSKRECTSRRRWVMKGCA